MKVKIKLKNKAAISKRFLQPKEPIFLNFFNNYQ